MAELVTGGTKSIIRRIVLLFMVQYIWINVNSLPEQLAPEMVLKLQAVRECDGMSGALFSVQNISLNFYNRSTILLNGVCVVSGTVESDLKFRIILFKCNNKQQLDSCGHYLSFEREEICNYLPKKNESWTHFMESIEGLDPNCPLQTGTYVIKDAPLDMSKLKKILVPGYWKIQLIGIHKGNVVAMCSESEYDIRLKKPNRIGR